MAHSARDVAGIRDALAAATYRVAAVRDRLGELAEAALGRGEVVPALIGRRRHDPLETLIRLFLLTQPVPAREVEAALPAAAARRLGFIDDGDPVRALLDLRPYADDQGDWWVASDLGSGPTRPGPVAHDHVLGIGGASLTLAGATVRRAGRRALDLGTGCGVQALHLSRHMDGVVATDRNPRAVRLARLTFALNGLEVDVREGSWLDPVADDRFDLVVSNPPFVVGPGGGLLYRDSGLAGDELTGRLVAELPRLLTPTGTAQLLGNWTHRRGEDWRERVAAWVPEGVDAWFLQREVSDPAQYVETWLRDAGQEDPAAYGNHYGRWLQWFARAEVEAVGFGLVLLRRSGGAPAWLRTEEVRHEVAPPLGPDLQAFVDRQDWLRGHSDLLTRVLRPAADLRLHQTAAPGPSGWVATSQQLRLSTGLRRRADVDEVAAAVVAGCDGVVPLGTILAVLAGAYGLSEAALTAAALPAVGRLIEDGFLEPADTPGR